MDDLPELAELGAITDPVARGKRAHELAGKYDAIADEARRIRRESLTAAVSEGGWSQGGVAKVLRLTRARVGQLINQGPKPERALLGIAPLTIVVAGKHDEKRPGPRPALMSEASGRAKDLLKETARDYGLASEYEVVPKGEPVRLDRAGLVVLGSPRLLPMMAQVLDADPHLGFASEDGEHWFLTEHGSARWSPNDLDNTVHADYAYIGRLPRTDSRGTFLYLAGIHGPGTLAAATYLTDNIESLYAAVGRGRWSMLIECTYDKHTYELESVEPLTQVYKPQDLE